MYSVLIKDMSLFQGCPFRGVPLIVYYYCTAWTESESVKFDQHSHSTHSTLHLHMHTHSCSNRVVATSREVVELKDIVTVYHNIIVIVGDW